MGMDTDSLRWFQLVADGYTVTEVSEIFGVSQPGVSRALARLEQQVGTPLLRRSGRVLRMTHAGSAFKRHVDHLVNDLDDALAAVDELVDPEGGVVTLAFPLSLGSWLVPGLIRAFRRDHPRVRVVLQRTAVGESGQVSQQLATRRADVELTTHRVTGPGVDWRRILVEPLVLAVPLVAPAGRARRRHAGRRRRRAVRHAPRPVRHAHRRRSPCARPPASRPPSTSRPTTCRPCAAWWQSGLGVAVVPAMGLPAPTTFARARMLPLTDAHAHREVGVAWVTGRPLLPSAESFRRFLLTGEVGAAPRVTESGPTPADPMEGHPMAPKQPKHKATILALANQKGGVAKTTSVASLGAAFAEQGRRVLLVDLDPQACLTFSLGVDPDAVESSVHDVLVGGTPVKDVIVSCEEGIDLVPSTIDLAGAEAVLLSRPAREYVLQGALDDVKRDYDIILLDCSPSLGVLTLNALTAAHGLVIPMPCEMLSHRGVGQLLDTVRDVKRILNKKLKVIGILPTLYDGRSLHSREVLEDVGSRYDLPVLMPPIPKTVRFAEAPAVGRSILSTARTSKGAKAYREVAAAILAQLGTTSDRRANSASRDSERRRVTGIK